MGRIKMLRPKVATADLRRVRLPDKKTAPIYGTPEFKAWREEVITRAGRRCEWVENGVRCVKAEPFNRMFADHRIELQDGGSPFDPANGQCLCGAHHTIKTNRARAAREAARACS